MQSKTIQASYPFNRLRVISSGMQPKSISGSTVISQDAIQKMFDIYAATGMLPKMDVAQFKHPTIVAPLQ